VTKATSYFGEEKLKFGLKKLTFELRLVYLHKLN